MMSITDSCHWAQVGFCASLGASIFSIAFVVLMFLCGFVAYAAERVLRRLMRPLRAS